MKYLVAVDDCFLDRPGGMGRVAWDIALLMRDRGHTVAMVAARPQPSTEASHVSVHDGIRVLRYSRPPLASWHPFRAQRIIRAARSATQQHFGRERWDVVHMHSALTAAGVLAAVGGGPRYVYTLHSPITMEQQINWASQGAVGQLKLISGLGILARIERQVLSACERIHTLSEYSRARLEEIHGTNGRVSVIPHWQRPALRREHTRAEARQQLGWPVDEAILLTVRTLAARYGVDIAIRAVAPMARQGQCAFAIGGDGPQQASLTHLAQSLNAGERIWFLGRLTEPQLALAYQAADLFLLPTRALECFGLIVLEALACGCPVLGTDAGAIPELLRPILPDYIVPAGDDAALQEKVQAFLAGRLSRTPEAQLIAHVQQYFGKSVIAPRIAALLEDGVAMHSTLMEAAPSCM